MHFWCLSPVNICLHEQMITDKSINWCGKKLVCDSRFIGKKEESWNSLMTFVWAKYIITRWKVNCGRRKGFKTSQKGQNKHKTFASFSKHSKLDITKAVIQRPTTESIQTIVIARHLFYVYTAVLTMTFFPSCLHLHNSDNKSLVTCMKGSRLKIDMQKLSRQWHLTMSM